VHSPEEEQLFRQALDWAGHLTAGTDFVLDRAHGRVRLSDGGSDRLAVLADSAGGLWRGARRREELVEQALAALHLYERDRHYLVQGGRVLIIDEHTGRTMADRSWERGLHQMIEIREGLSVSGRNEHIARLTYQRFFRRYQWLSGMTGTAREVRRELWSIYRLAVVPIAPHRPCQRRLVGARVHADGAGRWAEVVRRVQDLQAVGRPVLVGTRSVADSEHFGALLQAAAIPHQVLNARQDADEAAIIARAGTWGAVTVATNMAGRGTDIRLGAGVAELGGLHVIATERNDAGRIDRQLFGRAARQGDPGSCEVQLSLEDDLLRDHQGGRPLLLLGALLRRGVPGAEPLALLLLRRAQRSRERRHQALRRSLLRLETRLGRLLAFSGRME
jgi:preprotein translocase subunit SecA